MRAATRRARALGPAALTALTVLAACAVLALLGASPARAQGQGFQLNRYEPTAPGEGSFLVDHPWYSSTRYFAAGLTLNYAHAPLVFSDDSGRVPVIEHQLSGHLDLAGSFLDRVTLSASLPVVLLEQGTAQPAYGVGPGGASVGDPRFGAMVRLFGQPDRSAFSIHLGAQVWVPLRKFTDALPATASDQEVRVLPKLVLAGLGRRVRWSAMAGFLYRPEALLGSAGPAEGRAAGSAVVAGLLLQYADTARRFSVGPEALLGLSVTGPGALRPEGTSLELLLGASYAIAGQVQVGLAAGTALLGAPGTPDARALLRLAYAPIRAPRPLVPVDRDRDGDGLVDRLDRCPDEAEDRDGFQDEDGCPDLDDDGDGVPDRADRCKAEPGPPENQGCADRDSDGDGIVDRLDRCPAEPEDRDRYQDEDGCPDLDDDGDGVPDREDQCPEQPGPAENRGCADRDRDHDGTVDRADRCPDESGPPPGGCPERRYLDVSGDRITLRRPLHFGIGKAKLYPDSFPALNEVIEVLKARATARLRIEARTDEKGKAGRALQLSAERAEAVRRYLVAGGIDARRLTAVGLGQLQPADGEAAPKGRGPGGRVDLILLGEEAGAPAAAPPPPEEPAAPQRPERKRRRGR